MKTIQQYIDELIKEAIHLSGIRQSSPFLSERTQALTEWYKITNLISRLEKEPDKTKFIFTIMWVEEYKTYIYDIYKGPSKM